VDSGFRHVITEPVFIGPTQDRDNNNCKGGKGKSGGAPAALRTEGRSSNQFSNYPKMGSSDRSGRGTRLRESGERKPERGKRSELHKKVSPAAKVLARKMQIDL